jgi:hypothetical protein
MVELIRFIRAERRDDTANSTVSRYPTLLALSEGQDEITYLATLLGPGGRNRTSLIEEVSLAILSSGQREMGVAEATGWVEILGQLSRLPNLRVLVQESGVVPPLRRYSASGNRLVRFENSLVELEAFFLGGAEGNQGIERHSAVAEDANTSVLSPITPPKPEQDPLELDILAPPHTSSNIEAYRLSKNPLAVVDGDNETRAADLQQYDPTL